LDPNIATASGVVGALEAVSTKFGALKGTSFVIHGLGNVGGEVARQLVAAGATVHVYDVMQERSASIEGTNDLFDVIKAAGDDWAAAVPSCDVFVPCSKSWLIGTSDASVLQAKAVCGATNMPFACAESQEAFVNGGGLFVPESITSAGAVIADSIEHFDLKGFETAHPPEVYAFTRDAVFQKTLEAIKVSEDELQPVAKTVSQLSSQAKRRAPIGKQFRPWQATKTVGNSRAFGSSTSGSA